MQLSEGWLVGQKYVLKETGTSVSEESMLAMVAEGRFAREDFQTQGSVDEDNNSTLPDQR